MTEKFQNKEKKRIWMIIFGLILFNAVVILITLLTHAGLHNWNFSNAFYYLYDQVYLNNFFKQPALVLGFLTLIGYLVMGRSAKDSILGSLKCVIGYVLLAIGSGVLTGVGKPVFEAISKVGKGLKVVPLDPYYALDAGTKFFENFRDGANFASLITYVFVCAFAINIILVALKKWTNVHSLMVTGHVMLQQAAVVTPAFYILLFGNVPLIDNVNISGAAQGGLIVIAGLFLGVYWGVGSTSTFKATNKVTGNAGFAIGHQQMLTISLAYKLSKFFGKAENSAETKKMPKSLKIFEDNIFVQTVIITSLFIILFVVLLATGTIKTNGAAFDKEIAPNLANQWNAVFSGAHWTLNILGGGIKLVAALICMMTGVRMFVTELQQSFTGISEKLIKDAVVAVDIAAVYGFAPNSVTFAFASGTIAQFIGTLTTIGFYFIPGSKIAIMVPLFVTLFFNSGALGPFANAVGGFRAVLIVPAIIGFVEIIIISMGLWAIANASTQIGSIGNWNADPFAAGYIGMGDWNLFFGSLMLISGWTSILAWITVPIYLIIMLGYGQILDSGKQHKKTWLQKLLKLNPELIPVE